MSKHTDIVDELIALREKRGISQSAVADSIGVDQAVISNWERKKRKPKGPALKLLQAFLDAQRKAAA
jgi:DNA-binding transcriptional regulator YiaG